MFPFKLKTKNCGIIFPFYLQLQMRSKYRNRSSILNQEIVQNHDSLEHTEHTDGQRGSGLSCRNRLMTF